jgi:phospholipid/cholesterol/gamma-HCH transport system permease protein
MKLVIQSDAMVPGFAAMLILRELGVVVTALLLTSRVGAGIAAEIGTMKVTEQIDALKMLGIKPLNYLVMPRFFACVLGAVVLTIFANMTCLFSAIAVSQSYLGFTTSQFLSAMRRFVHFQDFIFALIKAATFGAVIPLVSCFFGFRCEAGAEGVGRATTNSVVVGSIAVIGLDFVLSYIFSFLY